MVVVMLRYKDETHKYGPLSSSVRLTLSAVLTPPPPNVFTFRVIFLLQFVL